MHIEPSHYEWLLSNGMPLSSVYAFAAAVHECRAVEAEPDTEKSPPPSCALCVSTMPVPGAEAPSTGRVARAIVVVDEVAA